MATDEEGRWYAARHFATAREAVAAFRAMEKQGGEGGFLGRADTILGFVIGHCESCKHWEGTHEHLRAHCHKLDCTTDDEFYCGHFEEREPDAA